MINKKHIGGSSIIPLIIILCVGIFSCDFDLEDENTNQQNEIIKQKVKINIEEAKILSNITYLNENIIALNQLDTEKDKAFQMQILSKNFKEDHIDIKNNLQLLAEKKLILLPTKFDKSDINELSKLDETQFSKAYLNKVESLMSLIKKELEYLSNITNDIDFKVLTIKTLVTINYNLNQIHKT